MGEKRRGRSTNQRGGNPATPIDGGKEKTLDRVMCRGWGGMARAVCRGGKRTGKEAGEKSKMRTVENDPKRKKSPGREPSR